MIQRGFHAAETEEEKLAVYRLRYDVYVAEMGRYRAAADHERRLLVEPEDATARIFYAAPEGEVVATVRLSWGGDAPFSARQIEHYQLEPFLAELPPEAIAVGERGMVVARLRGSPVYEQLAVASQRFLQEKRVQLLFGACEPHLLSLYLGRGSRPYAKRNINSPEAGDVAREFRRRYHRNPDPEAWVAAGWGGIGDVIDDPAEGPGHSVQASARSSAMRRACPVAPSSA